MLTVVRVIPVAAIAWNPGIEAGAMRLCKNRKIIYHCISEIVLLNKAIPPSCKQGKVALSDLPKRIKARSSVPLREANFAPEDCPV